MNALERKLANLVLFWMTQYNQIRPPGTLGVIVPSVDELVDQERAALERPVESENEE